MGILTRRFYLSMMKSAEHFPNKELLYLSRLIYPTYGRNIHFVYYKSKPANFRFENSNSSGSLIHSERQVCVFKRTFASEHKDNDGKELTKTYENPYAHLTTGQKGNLTEVWNGLCKET